MTEVGLTQDGFLTRVKNALNDMAEVRVVTLVGDLPIKFITKGDSTETSVDEKTLTGNSIVTIVKLLDGDVTTVISESLLANTELRSLHTAQVTASLEVLPRNLKGLIDIAKSLTQG